MHIKGLKNCTQRMALSFLRNGNIHNPHLAQVIILTINSLGIAGRLTMQKLEKLSVDKRFELELGKNMIGQDGSVFREGFGQGMMRDLAKSLQSELQLNISQEQIVEEIKKNVFLLTKENLSSFACTFSNFGNPINSLQRIPTCGANPHLVYRMKRSNGEVIYFKNEAMDVEKVGSELVSLVMGYTYKIEQVELEEDDKGWGISEEVKGVKINEIVQTEGNVKKIGLDCGKYFLAAWVFGIIERDATCSNLLVDPQTFEVKFIDFEVILCPHHADEFGLSYDLLQLLCKIKPEFREAFLLSLQEGFFSGCRVFEQKGIYEKSLSIVRRAFEKKIKIGFTGHEAGGGAQGITHTRKPLPLYPDDQTTIEKRMDKIAKERTGEGKKVFARVINRMLSTNKNFNFDFVFADKITQLAEFCP